MSHFYNVSEIKKQKEREQKRLLNLPKYIKTTELALVVHRAVDHVKAQGVGIAVVQTAQSAQTGTNSNGRIPPKELKYGWDYKDLVHHNARTAQRAQMLALVYGLGSALGTVERNQREEFIMNMSEVDGNLPVRKMEVLCESEAVVGIVNHHLENEPESFGEVLCKEDLSVIKRIVSKARKLKRRDVEVVVAVSDKEDKAAIKASRMATQRGHQACKSRLQAKVKQLMAKQRMLEQGSGASVGPRESNNADS